MTSKTPRSSESPQTLRKPWCLALALAGLVLPPWVLLARVYYLRNVDHTQVAKPSQGVAVDMAAFPLNLDPTHRYLTDHQGKPFLIHGEAAWSLVVQLKREDAETYLEDRRRRGVNLIIVNLLEHRFADHPPLNVYGAAPFATAGDFSTPQDKYFEHAREVVRMASTKGIAVLLCPAYLGGDGGPEGWYQEMRRNGRAPLLEYGRFVGSRFREFNNIIWLNGGDYTPPAADLGLVAAVAQGIRSSSPMQLHTAHWSPETSSLDVKGDFVFDLNATYTYLPAYLKSLADDDHGNGRAHFLVESKYEADELGSTQRSLRGQAYYALLTGAMGQVCGNRWIWQFTRATVWNRPLRRNWQAALDSPTSRSMSHLRRLFAQLPWTTLAPDETFEVQISGQGSKGNINYPMLAWNRDGRLAVAYLPTLQGIRLNLGKLKVPLRVRWYDPTDGRFAEVPGSPFATTGERTFIPTGNNASGDTDWVLVIESLNERG